MKKLLYLLLSSVLFSSVALATPTITEPVAELASSTDASSYAMTAFTPTANAVLLVFVHASGTVATGTMSGGGLTWTKKTSVLNNTTDTNYLFWAKTGSSPVSTTVTFDCTGDAATGVIMAAFQATGADIVTADPIKQVKTNAATAANPTVTMDTALTTTNAYAGFFGVPRNPPTSAAPASWTETLDTGHTTPTQGASGAYRNGGETGTTVTFTSVSAAYGIIVAEVYNTGAGPSAGNAQLIHAID